MKGNPDYNNVLKIRASTLELPQEDSDHITADVNPSCICPESTIRNWRVGEVDRNGTTSRYGPLLQNAHYDAFARLRKRLNHLVFFTHDEQCSMGVTQGI